MTESHKLQYPCEFTIKVFGKKTKAFETSVMTTVNQFVKKLRENAYQFTESKEGRYLSITITFTADSEEHITQIGKALQSCDDVIMVI